MVLSPSLPHFLITPSLPLRLVQSSLPPSLSLFRLLYSSWPLHNRTQIEIVLRRNCRAFLRLTRTHAHRVTAGLRIRPASLRPLSLAKPPHPAGWASCVFDSYCLFACVRQRRLFQHGDAPCLLSQPGLKKIKHGENLENLAERPAATAGHLRTPDSFRVCNRPLRAFI